MKNFRFRVRFIFLVFVMVCYCPLEAQTKKTELLKGIKISTSIKPGEKHQYSVYMKENQFGFFRLIQRGVDVIITTYDPDGKKLEEFDSPNGKDGLEPITIISDKKGNYVLEVKPLEDKAAEGNYELETIKIEPKGVTPDKQVDQLFAAWDNPETPGASVAVVKDGKIVFKKGYGSANLEYNIPITPSTVFHIASVSKQFTAFSILLLARDGKLSLDDDIRKYIPEVPDFGKVITLRELAHHTSGLRDQWNLLAMAGWRLDDVITKEHILKLVSRQKELNFNPGDEFLYCNTGFTLLAEVVARVSDQTFADFTRDHIFKSLRMTSTLFYDDHEKILKNRAYSFYDSPTGYKKSVLNYANVGATSLFTTAEDLSLWAMNFENPVVGDKNIINEMNTKGILNKGDTISYALGQDIGKYKGLKFISHSGGDAGYRSFLGRFPDQRFSVIVLSNDASFDPGGLALKIADIYLKDKIVSTPPKEKTITPEENKPVQVNIDSLKAFSGQYELQPGMIVTITRENDKLSAEAPGLSKIVLNQVSSSEFTIKGMDAKLTFKRDQDNKISKVKVFLSGQEIIAPRMKDFDPLSVNLAGFTGEYFSPELSTSYKFGVEDGKLVAHHNRLSDFVLIPVKPDNFSTDRWFFSQVEFVRDSDKNIIGCRVSSGRVRNLWFKKAEN
jgi:CubicO group peptidase (beta-lactamase class C family)